MNIINGDCLEELKKLEDNSVDAVITDPPYGLSNTKPQQVADVLKAWVAGDTVSVPAKRGGFMGKDWDSFVPPPAVWEECMRVLKPGGHMAVFAGARTQDLMGLSIRLAGFEIRDTLGWVYGSGFPKSQNIARQLDKTLGEDVPIGKSFNTAGGGDRESEFANNGRSEAHKQWSPMSDAAKQWDGWGTALKPAIEPIILARKPLDGTVARNVLAHGVGGLNIDACRVGTEVRVNPPGSTNPRVAMGDGWNEDATPTVAVGRFPANVLLDEHAAKEMDRQSGVSVSKAGGRSGTHFSAGNEGVPTPDRPRGGHNDSGGASRFFPVFKSEEETPETKGRFPANVLLDEHAAAEMDKQSVGTRAEKPSKSGTAGATVQEATWKCWHKPGEEIAGYNDSGGASRFFPVFKYQAKAPKKERPVIVREDGTKVQHPTVKPLALMEWLATLITPEGGTVLDPFAGTGTTLQAALNKGFQPIGIEQDADYIQLIHQRLEGGEQSTRSS